MTVVKPRPDHPWRSGCILRREISEHIRHTTINPKVNSWKVGGAHTWNGKK